jgi:peptidyl-prolyl cis-trans isomerase D
MLQDFRNNLRGVALGIVIVIAAIFALTGTGSLFVNTPDSESALIVNGHDVSQRELQQAIARERSRILTENPELDSNMLDDGMLRATAIQQLVALEVMVESSKDQKFGVAPKLVSDLILGVEQFQTDGQFDEDKFRFVLRNQGYFSSTNFTEMLKDQFLVQQLSQGIINTSFVTAAEIVALASLADQMRDYDYTRVALKPYVDQVALAEQQIADYYDSNKEQYTTERKVAIEYIRLNADMLLASQQVSDEAVQDRYDQEAETADTGSSLRAAHILLSDPSDELLQEIQGKLDNNADFAVLAKEYSEDVASAENGGDLGFTSGDTFPESFEQALAALEVGQVSTAVETDAGTHFIKLLETQASTFEFAEQKDRIVQDLKKEAAEELLVEKLEMLKELSFNAENLQEVATDLALQAEISEPFSENGGAGVASSPLVIKAAYSAEVLEDGYASEVIDLGDDNYIVIRLHEDFPARQQTLAEVEQAVRDTLTASVAQEQIEAQAEAILERLNAGEEIEAVADSLELEWKAIVDGKRAPFGVDPEVNYQAFDLPMPRDNAVIDSFYSTTGDFVAIKLKKVTLGKADDLTDDRKLRLRSIAEPSYSGREVLSYQQTLVGQADIVQ